MDLNDLGLADLRAFFLVAETGSFARAAHRLDSSKSIVSRRVAKLEEALATQLLLRTTQGTQLSPAGQHYYEQARAALTQLDCAAEDLNRSQFDISGAIRITVPIYFGAMHLASVFCEFMRLYPNVELEINLSDEKIDIARAGFDLAVRAGHLPDSGMTCRLLCQSRRTLVASPDYLAANPAIHSPQDLAAHRLLHYNSLNPNDLWRYHEGDEIRQLNATPYLRCNSGTILMAAVSAGLGLTILPTYVTDAAVRAGTAVEVLGDVDWGVSPINLLTPAGRQATKRVRALIDFLVASFHKRTL